MPVKKEFYGYYEKRRAVIKTALLLNLIL